MNNTSSIAVMASALHNNNLRRTLDCIAQQTIKPHRLIVTNSNGTKSDNIIKQWIAEARPAFEIALINVEAQATLGASRNTALNYIADCQFIYFTDAYHLPSEDFFERALQTFTSDTSLVAVHPDQIVQPNKQTPCLDLRALPENPWLWLMQCRLEIAGMLLLQASAVNQAGWFNPLLSLGTDVDFYARIANQGRFGAVLSQTMTQMPQNTITKQQTQPPDYHRQWALVCERLLDDYKIRVRVARKLYRSLLAQLWYQAGLSLLERQQIEQAHDCFTRSLSWQILNPSALCLMKITRLKKIQNRG